MEAGGAVDGEGGEFAGGGGEGANDGAKSAKNAGFVAVFLVARGLHEGVRGKRRSRRSRGGRRIRGVGIGGRRRNVR